MDERVHLGIIINPLRGNFFLVTLCLNRFKSVTVPESTLCTVANLAKLCPIPLNQDRHFTSFISSVCLNYSEFNHNSTNFLFGVMGKLLKSSVYLSRFTVLENAHCALCKACSSTKACPKRDKRTSVRFQRKS